MKRRTLLTGAATALALTPFAADAEEFLTSLLETDEEKDAATISRIFRFAAKANLKKRKIHDVVAEVGKQFIGTPYVANTCEVPGEERLVVNLRGMDCQTFSESSFAFARCIKKGTKGAESFRKELQLIRYRDGVIDRYPSRLHYFTEWIDNNEKKGLVKNIAGDLGGVPFVKKINFMTTHPESYRQLQESPEFIPAIRLQEERVSSLSLPYIPKEKVNALGTQIPNGSIIGITSNVEGLDINHTGIAVHIKGNVRFLHAPLSGKKVLITKESLGDYLLSLKAHSGIMVLVPQEPL